MMKNSEKVSIFKKLVGLSLFVGLVTTGCSGGQSHENPIVQTGDTQFVVEEFTQLTVATLGDSISTGFNSVTLQDVYSFRVTPFTNQREQNWSTGNGRTSLQSHYQRIRQKFSPTRIQVNRVSEATAAEKVITNSYNGLLGQAIQLESQLNKDHFNYVTVLMGANDVCTTSFNINQFRTNFRNQVQLAVEKLLAKADLILLSSLPNVAEVIYGRYCSLNDSIYNELVEANCPNAAWSRNVFDDYVRAANEAYQEVAALYPNQVRYDQGAVYNSPITQEKVSQVDCFHPSPEGQRSLSETLWQSVDPVFSQYIPAAVN